MRVGINQSCLRPTTSQAETPEVCGLFSLLDLECASSATITKPIDQFGVMAHRHIALILAAYQIGCSSVRDRFDHHLGQGGVVIWSCIEHQAEGASRQKRNLIVDGLNEEALRTHAGEVEVESLGQSGGLLPALLSGVRLV
jgi:hypothetical protein